MKKSFLVLIVMIPALVWSQEQPSKYWILNGITGLNLNQASFSNWTAGGVNSVAFSALGKFSANYKKDKLTWNNNLNLLYGMVKNQDETLKKSEDIMELISVLGTDISKKWAFTGYMSFRSQFADGYDKDNDTIRISKFMAPGYLTLSPGFRYKPNDWFYIILSPATAKFTFVEDQTLADQGSFGVTPAEYDTIDGYKVKVKDGEKMLIYFGPFLEAYMKKEVAKGLTYESRLNILYTFINRDNLKSYDADLSWENFLNYSIAKYFSISVFLHFVYLPGQPTIKFDNSTGVAVPNAVPNRHIQVKETLGIGLTYTFPAGKVKIKVDDKTIAALRSISCEIRADILRSITEAGSGHTGGSLDLADLFTTLYFHILRHKPEHPSWEDRDRLILSIGHVAPVLYTTLAHAGYFPREELLTLRKLGSRLQGHPGRDHGLPGIELSAGSLGQGLSVAVGMAITAKMDKAEWRVYSVHGDGEMQEGSIWEAAMSAAHYKLDNLVAFIDRNGVQIDGRTSDVMEIEPLEQKWKAFGWEVFQCDGHDHRQIADAANRAKEIKGRPSVIILKTIMGKGVKSIEGDYRWHGKAPTRLELERFLKELT